MSHDAHIAMLSPFCFILFVPKHYKVLVFSVAAGTSHCRLTVGSYEVQPRLRRAALRMSPHKQIQLFFYTPGSKKFKMILKALKICGTGLFCGDCGHLRLAFRDLCECRNSLVACPTLHQPDILFFLLSALTNLLHCSADPWNYIGFI